jgi:hypothetical protein
MGQTSSAPSINYNTLETQVSNDAQFQGVIANHPQLISAVTTALGSNNTLTTNISAAVAQTVGKDSVTQNSIKDLIISNDSFKKDISVAAVAGLTDPTFQTTLISTLQNNPNFKGAAGSAGITDFGALTSAQLTTLVTNMATNLVYQATITTGLASNVTFQQAISTAITSNPSTAALFKGEQGIQGLKGDSGTKGDVGGIGPPGTDTIALLTPILKPSTMWCADGSCVTPDSKVGISLDKGEYISFRKLNGQNHDSNHGIGYRDNFPGLLPRDGPFLWGSDGGQLGTNGSNVTKAALVWDNSGNVNVMGNLNVNSGVNSTGNSAIASQGAYLQWNKKGGGGDGATYLINQKGTSTSNAGISFGTSDASDKYSEGMYLDGAGNLHISGNLIVDGGITGNNGITANGGNLSVNNGNLTVKDYFWYKNVSDNKLYLGRGGNNNYTNWGP